MAIFKTKPSGLKGFDFLDIDVEILADYDFWKATSSSFRAYDDAKNYTLFSGSGIKVKNSGSTLIDVTAGTVKGLDIVEDGTKTLSVTGLNLKATKIYDYFAADDDAGARNYLLSGNDTITGTKYADYLLGGAGKDKIEGGTGRDTLKGDAGNDRLDGGAGDDTLYGGTGADTFVFKPVKDTPGHDRIADFSQREGDRIDLKALDADATRAGNQPFKFIGDDAFHNKAGELRYQQYNNNTVVLADTDGDGKTDFWMNLSGKIDLVKGDFIL